MKKILFFIFALLAITAGCDKNDTPDKGKLDPNATILIRPAKGVKLKSTITGLTAMEIVEQAIGLRLRTHWLNNAYIEDEKTGERGFADAQRNLEIPALKMWGTDIISQSGEFVKDFLYSYDIYITTENNDTIAYIPNSVIENARNKIEVAFSDENYTEVYRLFDEAFTFLPISAQE